MIHVNRSGQSLGIFDEARVREGLATGEFIGTDLGWREGMPTWRPLSELENFGATPPPPPIAPTEPTATVEAEQTYTTQPAIANTPIVTPSEATGLPWENRERLGFANALVATIAMVITRPAEAFTVMKREGGLGDALLYAIILGLVGALASFGFTFVLPTIGLGASSFGDVLGLGASAGFLLLAPFGMILGIFIGGAIIHVCLMLLGGANRSFETTIRVLCYAGGSANIFVLVPVCGGMIASVVTLVLDCIGLARAHETETWKPVAAVLLPMVVCCGGFMIIAIFVGALGSNWN